MSDNKRFRTYAFSLFSLFVVTAVLSAPTLANTKYVTDKITLEIHETSSSTSSLIEQVASGTPLVVMETDGAFAKVETPDKKIGWVEAAYLMNEKPAQLMYTELKDKHRRSLALIVDLKQNKLADTSEEEKSKITAMRAELKKAREKNKTLKSTLSNRKLNNKAAIEDKKLMQLRISELEKKLGEKTMENNDNIQELNNLMSKNSGDDSFFEGTDNSASGFFSNAVPLIWFLVGIGIFMIMGAFAGATMLDVHNRRKHGGFRI